MANQALGMTYGDNGSKGIVDVPKVTKEPRQRSLTADDILFTRYLSPWARPSSVTAEQWRAWVFYQPVAMICRETLTANVLSKDWVIIPRDSKYRDELSASIKYYTKLLERGGYYYGFDYSALLEWLLTDLQDLPFGTGMEIGHKNDSPTGRVQWMKPIDAATLYPTLNMDYPVIQYYHSNNVIWFPKHAIARAYMSPRTEITYEGWGLAPPEKVVMALEMLNRGDRYYANLLLEVPPAGILDLGDMEKDSALDWVKAFKSWSQGNLDAFSIPILYEHTSPAKFLPFGKVPNDLMYDKITLKYAAIVCAAYGMSLGDIGFQSVSASGETLAGSIRSERKTKRTGLSRAMKKIKYMFDSILPDTLEFKFIDLDDELNVSLGRARLADATAGQILIQNGVLDAAEVRLQLLEDGVININIPEEPPQMDAQPLGKNPERPGMLGRPEAASSGGQGEVRLSTISVKKSKAFDKHVSKFVKELSEEIVPIFESVVNGVSEDEFYLVRSSVDAALFDELDALGLSQAVENAWKNKNWLRLALGDVNKELATLAENYILEETEGDVKTLKNRLSKIDFDELGDKFADNISSAIKEFVGKSAVYILKDIILVEDMLDDTVSVDYDSIVELASNRLIEHFDEFVQASVNTEAENLLQKVKNEVTEND